MTLAAGEGGSLIAALAAEPGFAPLAEAELPVFLWRPGSEAPAWASPGGRALLSRLATSLDGSPRLPTETALRLARLGQGLAPRTGFRLERLRWGGMEPPLTLACRIISHSGEDYLLAADPQALSQARAPRENSKSGAEADGGGDRPLTVVPPAATAPRRGQRFTWRADAEGRFTSVSPELAEVVGTRGADVVGFRWDDLVGRLVEDGDGAVAAAWRRGEGWTRCVVGWRDPDRDRLVPVELSAAPLSGEGGGHRGFGVAHPAQSRPLAPGAFLDPPARPPPPAVETLPPTTIGEAVGAAAAALGERAGETVFGMLRAWLVPEGGAQGRPLHEPAGREPEEMPTDGALTSSERGALHEIARTLRDGGDDADAPADRPSAEIVALPRPVPRAEPTALLDQLPVGIVVVRDGVPLFANRHLLEALGVPDLPQAVADGSLQELSKLGPDDAAAGAVTLGSGQAATFEARVARIEWGDLGADLVLLSPPPAAPAAEVEALRLDLDARAVRLDELKAALDLAADGVVTLDPAARLLSLTRSAERLFGIASNEVVGDSITALIEPQDHRAALACLNAVRTGPSGAVQQCEVRGRTRGGQSIPLSMRAGRSPGDGEPGFSVAFSDVTHFRMMESDLREAQSAAEQASANRADFLARISHEVRTPLTAITGFAELMLDERFGPLGNERYKGYIRDIRDSGVHVLSLVNDLLDLAKATSGAQDLHPAPLDLNAVVQQCVALAGPLAGQERTIIRTSFPSNLPPVVADERSIRQIVINLLSNAIRFTGAGGQVIVSTAIGGGDEVVLSVRDTGIGMTDEEVETALTPFRQVSATRRSDGTGLGLPLSKALTEANGGVFVVTSARELGTLVEVRLPAEKHRAVAAE